MIISGYFAIFDVPDSGGDIVRRSAFDDFLARNKEPVPVCWEHQRAVELGLVDRFEVDDRGAWASMTLDRSFERFDDLTARIINGLLSLSFGYQVREKKDRNGFRELLRVNLVEVSLVNFPMQPLARLDPLQSSTLERAA